jgi:cellulose biosynthesis protein BcsQ
MSVHCLVGAVGGAGTTRLALEIGALLARDGREVALLDAAYATQGLADHVPGRIDPDATELALSDGPLSAGMIDLDVDPGRLAACPARAPFERLARAKSSDAAERFERRVAEAAETFDRVIVDAPPVAANQAVAAVTAADRVAVVAPDTRRGRDAVPRLRDRLADVGVAAAAALYNRTDDPPADADAAVLESDAPPADVPVCATADGAFPAAVAGATEALFGVDLDLTFESPGAIDRLAALADSH